MREEIEFMGSSPGPPTRENPAKRRLAFFGPIYDEPFSVLSLLLYNV